METERAMPFYGWFNVLFCALIYIGVQTIFNNGFYTSATYCAEILSISKTLLYTAMTVHSIVSGCFAFLTGRIISRFGVKKTVFIGLSFMIIGSAIILIVPNIVTIYIGLCLMGIAIPLSTNIPGQTVITRWFDKRKGMAIAIFGTIYSVAAMVVSPVVRSLVINHGWQDYYWALLIGAGVAFIIEALLVREEPSKMGQVPDGKLIEAKDMSAAEQEKSAKKKARQTSAVEFTAKEAVRTKELWIVTLIFCVAQFLNVAIKSQGQNAMSSYLDPVLTATIIGAFSTISLVGRLGSGVISDFMSPKYVLVLGSVLSSGGMLLFMQGNTSSVFAWLTIALSALGYGLLNIGVSTAYAGFFGRKDYSKIFSIGVGASTIVAAVANTLTSVVQEKMGYHGVFVLCLALCIICVILAIFCRAPQKD